MLPDERLILYNVKDVQSIFRCGRDKAYNIMNAGGFPSVKIGTQLLVEKQALEKWLAKQQGRHVRL